MKNFNVGIQLYGVRDTLERDFIGTLRAIREMGYDYVEFAGNYGGRTGEEIKDILDGLGLKCISVHQGPDMFIKQGQAAVDFFKAFGVIYPVIPWYGPELLAGTENWENSKKMFSEVADLLHENGMTLGYHNHDFEFRTYEGKYLHDYIFEALPEGKIFPEIDTCWVHYAGIRPEEKIREFAGRVPVVHLKDFVCQALGGGPVYDLIDDSGKGLGKSTQEESGFEFRPLGMGIQDFGAILAACEEAGTETVIVEQDKTYGGMTELEAAKISRDYLRDTFGI